MRFENSSDALAWLHGVVFEDDIISDSVQRTAEPWVFETPGSFRDADGTMYDIRYEKPDYITICTPYSTGEDSKAITFDDSEDAFAGMVDFVEHTRTGDIIWYDKDTKQRYNEERFEHVQTSISDGRDNAKDELEQREKN